MSQELKRNTELTLERFQAEQEQLEKLAFDSLNLSDTIRNSAKKAMACLEKEEKEKAILDAKDCLTAMLEQLTELSEVVHSSEAAFDRQQDNLEAIRMVIDFLCCEWDVEAPIKD